MAFKLFLCASALFLVVASGSSEYSHLLNFYKNHPLCGVEPIEVRETWEDVENEVGSMQKYSTAARGIWMTTLRKDEHNWVHQLMSNLDLYAACNIYQHSPLPEYNLDFILPFSVDYNIDQLSLIHLGAATFLDIPAEVEEFVLPTPFQATEIASSGVSNYTVYDGPDFNGNAYCLRTYDIFSEWGYGVIFHEVGVWPIGVKVASIRKNVCEGKILGQHGTKRVEGKSCLSVSSFGQRSSKC